MTHKKDVLIGFLVIIVLAAGFFWYLATHPTAVPLPQTATTTPTGAPAPGLITKSTRFYDIRAEYPSRTPLYESVGVEADAKAVATMKAWEESEIATFKVNGAFDSLTEEDLEMQGYNRGRTQALQFEYELKTGPKTITYVYLVYSDTMGAHPNAYYRTFTFDSATGVELDIQELFTPGSSYLNVLSDKSRAILIPQIAEASAIPVSELDTSFIDDGTKPNPENFQWFYFEGSDLVLIFPPYQVGPWALGMQDAHIPRSELSAVLKTEYQ